MKKYHAFSASGGSSSDSGSGASGCGKGGFSSAGFVRRKYGKSRSRSDSSDAMISKLISSDAFSNMIRGILKEKVQESSAKSVLSHCIESGADNDSFRQLQAKEPRAEGSGLGAVRADNESFTEEPRAVQKDLFNVFSSSFSSGSHHRSHSTPPRLRHQRSPDVNPSQRSNLRASDLKAYQEEFPEAFRDVTDDITRRLKDCQQFSHLCWC